MHTLIFENKPKTSIIIDYICYLLVMNIVSRIILYISKQWFVKRIYVKCALRKLIYN